jgi:hypothetical protein
MYDILMYLMRQLKVEPSNVFFHCSNRNTVYIPLSCCRYILENAGQLEAQFKRQPARYTLLHILYPYTLFTVYSVHCTSFYGLEDLITGRCNPLAIGAGHRLSMELVYLGSMSRDVHSCTHWLRPRNPSPSPRVWTGIRECQS